MLTYHSGLLYFPCNGTLSGLMLSHFLELYVMRTNNFYLFLGVIFSPPEIISDSKMDPIRVLYVVGWQRSTLVLRKLLQGTIHESLQSKFSFRGKATVRFVFLSVCIWISLPLLPTELASCMTLHRSPHNSSAASIDLLISLKT